MSASHELSEPASLTARLLCSSQGRATRRQWWLGHLSAALLACLGFIGGMGVIISAAVRFGLEPGEIGFKLTTMTVAALCSLQFAVTSNALCRRRLNERGEPHHLLETFVGLGVLETVLALNDTARAFMIDHWPLPAAPPRLAAILSMLCLGSLAALVLECGVLERLSLTEIWRGRRAP